MNHPRNSSPASASRLVSVPWPISILIPMAEQIRIAKAEITDITFGIRGASHGRESINTPMMTVSPLAHTLCMIGCGV